MTHDLHHLAGAYVLDALDGEERDAFEAHYLSCEVCTQEVAEFRETAAILAADAAAPVPEALRRQVMDEIGRTRQIPPIVPERVVELAERRSANRRNKILAVAAAALIGVIASVAALRSGPNGPSVEDVVAASDAVAVELSGDLDGQIEVIWSPARDQVAVVGSGLAAPGEGLAYALWFILDDGVAPAALFAPDADGDVRVVLDVDDLAAGGWGVTIEPDTGSPQPTTDVIYVGTI